MEEWASLHRDELMTAWDRAHRPVPQRTPRTLLMPDMRAFSHVQVQATHCDQGEEIHQYIVRRAMTASRNPIQRLSEATLAWNRYMAYIRRLCPESAIASLPGWFHNLLEDDPHYPDGYNPKLVEKNYDFWMGGLDDEEWEDPDCECDDCDDDHDRDEMGNCLCPICFESEDDP